MSNYTALSLFSGCGGFCEGARLAKFTTLGAVENDRFAAQTYRHNFPDVPLFEEDVAAFFNARDKRWHSHAMDFQELQERGVDLLFGGPPCQGYSQIGTRLLDDPRNRLYREYVRLLKRFMPRVFIMENVPNMLLLGKGRFKRDAFRAFAQAGYSNTTVRLISASNFGVPQYRKRAIFFGIRDGLPFPFDVDAWLEHVLADEQHREASVSEAMGDLPDVVGVPGELLRYPPLRVRSDVAMELRLDCDGLYYNAREKEERAGGLVLHNHHTKEIQNRRRELIAHLKPGAKADSLPKRMWDGLRPEKWRRLDPDKPAYTILAQMHRDLSEWVHPRYERWITVREAARLQSFHDGFVFQSSEWQMLKQIGNAVPPLMGRALCVGARRALEYVDEVSTSDESSWPQVEPQFGIRLRLSI